MTGKKAGLLDMTGREREVSGMQGAAMSGGRTELLRLLQPRPRSVTFIVRFPSAAPHPPHALSS